MQIRPITESQINLIAKQCGFRGKLSKDLINTATTLSQILSNEGLSALYGANPPFQRFETNSIFVQYPRDF